MASLAELAAERRKALKEFEDNIYDKNAVYDMSELNERIEKTPAISRDDALAAINIILEHIDSDQHLATSMLTALRKYVDAATSPSRSGHD